MNIEDPQPFVFALGEEVKDKITGVTGIVTAQTHWLTGCNTVTIKPRALKDGVPQDNMSFDEPWLERVGPGLRVDDKPKKARGSRGGPRPPAERAR